MCDDDEMDLDPDTDLDLDHEHDNHDMLWHTTASHPSLSTNKQIAGMSLAQQYQTNSDNNNNNDNSNNNHINRSENSSRSNSISRNNRPHVLRTFGMFDNAFVDEDIDIASYYRARDKWPNPLCESLLRKTKKIIQFSLTC